MHRRFERIIHRNEQTLRAASGTPESPLRGHLRLRVSRDSDSFLNSSGSGVVNHPCGVVSHPKGAGHGDNVGSVVSHPCGVVSHPSSGATGANQVLHIVCEPAKPATLIEILGDTGTFPVGTPHRVSLGAKERRIEINACREIEDAGNDAEPAGTFDTDSPLVIKNVVVLRRCEHERERLPRGPCLRYPVGFAPQIPVEETRQVIAATPRFEQRTSRERCRQRLTDPFPIRPLEGMQSVVAATPNRWR